MGMKCYCTTPIKGGKASRKGKCKYGRVKKGPRKGRCRAHRVVHTYSWKRKKAWGIRMGRG